MLYAPADWWPEATVRPVTYWPDAPQFSSQPLGWVMHVTVGNGSPWQTFEDAVSPNRRFSHLWIRKDGYAEQYAPWSHDSWAQIQGDDSYWSFEFEGFPSELMTPHQLATAARAHVWLKAPNAITDTPGRRGVICHQDGGAAWGGHTCPDPAMGLPGPRSRQRPAILALVTGGPMSHDPLSTTDLVNIAREDESYYQVRLPDGSMEVRDLAIGEILANSRQVLANTQAILTALKLPVNVTLDPGKLAGAMATELGHRLTPATPA